MNALLSFAHCQWHQRNEADYPPRCAEHPHVGLVWGWYSWLCYATDAPHIPDKFTRDPEPAELAALHAA